MRPLLVSMMLLVTLVSAPAFSATERTRDDAQTAYFRSRLRSLMGCFALGGSPSSRAKSDLSVEVQPPGDVSDVIVEGGGLPASVVSCMAARVRAWRFPPFGGQARRLRYSFVFVGQER